MQKSLKPKRQQKDYHRFTDGSDRYIVLPYYILHRSINNHKTYWSMVTASSMLEARSKVHSDFEVLKIYNKKAFKQIEGKLTNGG